MRHDGCGGLAAKAELLTGIEGASSLRVLRIVLNARIHVFAGDADANLSQPDQTLAGRVSPTAESASSSRAGGPEAAE
jgi:hypothetical protein